MAEILGNPEMKARHYEQLAKAIRENIVPIKNDVYLSYRVNQFLDDLCAILADENPKFNKNKFLEGCR